MDEAKPTAHDRPVWPLPGMVHDPIDREVVRHYLASRINEATARIVAARTIRHRREAIGALDELLTIYLPILGEGSA